MQVDMEENVLMWIDGCMAELLLEIDNIIHRILDFYTFIPFHQDVQLVNQDGLSTWNRGFGSEGLKQIEMASAWEIEGLILSDVSFC